jgi:adenylate cyclase
LLVAVLNEYLDGACQIITEGGGTIDKMIGDAIVSIFNAPIDQVDHAQKAVETAFLLDKFFTDFVARKKLQGIDMGITRIGINTGVATIGNFGGAQRFDYTVIGDAVNTAARIESANKYLGTRICVSGETMDQCSGLYFRPIASLVLKGKSLSVNVFEPIAEEVYKSPYIQSYIDFYKRIENNEAAGVAELIAIQKHLPTDPVINFHLQRMSEGENGVHIVMDKK